MPTNKETVEHYLDAALIQLAAESYMHGLDLSNQDALRTKTNIIRRLKYGFNDPTHPFILNKAGVGNETAENNTNGSNSPVLAAYNRMVQRQAEAFVDQYEIYRLNRGRTSVTRGFRKQSLNKSHRISA